MPKYNYCQEIKDEITLEKCARRTDYETEVDRVMGELECREKRKENSEKYG